MKKFIALYCNTSGAHQPQPELSDKEKEQMMAPWGTWAAKCGDRLLDMGSPFAPASSSTDGNSWVPSKNFITGYSIVQAKDLAEAEELFKGHPIYGYPDHAVEISECVAM